MPKVTVAGSGAAGEEQDQRASPRFKLRGFGRDILQRMICRLLSDAQQSDHEITTSRSREDRRFGSRRGVSEFRLRIETPDHANRLRIVAHRQVRFGRTVRTDVEERHVPQHAAAGEPAARHKHIITGFQIGGSP